MQVAFQIASIIVSVLLIILILLQVKGGGLGNLLGGDVGGGALDAATSGRARSAVRGGTCAGVGIRRQGHVWCPLRGSAQDVALDASGRGGCGNSAG